MTWKDRKSENWFFGALRRFAQKIKSFTMLPFANYHNSHAIIVKIPMHNRDLHHDRDS